MAYQYWGRTTANGAHGFLSIPQAMTQWNWYPCVRFTVNGGETESVSYTHLTLPTKLEV